MGELKMPKDEVVSGRAVFCLSKKFLFKARDNTFRWLYGFANLTLVVKN